MLYVNIGTLLCEGRGCNHIAFRFGLKTGIDFEHFGLKLGMVIGGTFTKTYTGRVTGEREREIDKIYHSS